MPGFEAHTFALGKSASFMEATDLSQHLEGSLFAQNCMKTSLVCYKIWVESAFFPFILNPCMFPRMVSGPLELENVTPPIQSPQTSFIMCFFPHTLTLWTALPNSPLKEMVLNLQASIVLMQQIRGGLWSDTVHACRQI